MRTTSQNPNIPHEIETDRVIASIAERGYVSGVASLLDKATGARDLGFGLDIVDFLLEPAPANAPIPEGQYHFGPGDPFHGEIPKRYVEGPQICTQAGSLPVEITTGKDFVAVRLRYRWHTAYPPHERAGSSWEQTLVFPDGARYFLASDRVTTVSTSPALSLRVDMPGHIKHEGGSSFEHVYLSYNDPPILPSTEFLVDFPPDARFRYRRPVAGGRLPERFIRAYQVKRPGDREGPWLAGMTLNPDDVDEAWCHQRGYVCLIQEIGGRPSQPGDTFGACYVVGWFDDLDRMNVVYDRYRGASGLALDGPAGRPTGFRTLRREELAPITGWDDGGAGR